MSGEILISVGQKYGRLTVTAKGEKIGKNRRTGYDCVCECGERVIVTSEYLRRSPEPSCGCANRKNKVALGQQFGRWTVVDATRREGKNAQVLCECSCDQKTQRLVSVNALIRGYSNSCGCINKELSRARIRQLPIGSTYGRLTVVGPPILKNDAGYTEVECSCERKTRKYVRTDGLLNGAVTGCGCIKDELLIVRNTTHGRSNTASYKRAKKAKRRARELQACPKWADELTTLVNEEAFDKARELYKITGVEHHVDHIVPLVAKRNNKHVCCGLHVYYNLQVITKEENLKKNCHNWEDSPSVKYI